MPSKTTETRMDAEETVDFDAPSTFPPNMQTAETARLFLQCIMRKPRVAGAPVPGDKPAAHGGRAAVVVPNGTLLGHGVCAVIKEEMLKEFHTDIVALLEAAHHAAARSVNALMTASYWEIGRRIVEFEQGGKGRAEHRQTLLKRLSADLSSRFGRGFSERNLEQMRLF